MNNADIQKKLEALTVEKDGKKYIDCPTALDFAKKNNISPADVAKVLNKNKIKITNCQLSCF